MEKSEQFSGIDIGKIGALHDSGWDNSDIASDMELDAETVEKVLEYRDTHQEEPEKEPESVKYIIMPDEEMNAAFDRAASIGAREAVKRFEQERRKDIKHRSDRRLHNTRILLLHAGRKHGRGNRQHKTECRKDGGNALPYRCHDRTV